MDSQPKYFEYIVVGLGGVGSGALYWLSRRAGKNVLGLEQFELGHDHGGSQDISRIIRLMYHNEKYTRLTRASFEAWREVEEESGIQLVYTPGGIDLIKGKSRKHILEAYAKAMDRQNIPYERLTAAQLRQKFPQFEVSDDYEALFQETGGLVDAAQGNSVHVQLARAHGATVIDKCPVLRLEPTSDGHTKVYTSQGAFMCRRLVVTAGAWINHVLGSVGVHVPVTVTQEQVSYFATPNIKPFTKERFPIYIFHGEETDLYGLPIYSNSYTKIGVDAGGPSVTPETRNYHPDPEREKTVLDFLKDALPKAVGPVAYTKTCLYTMTHDRDFLIDSLRTRNMPQIIVCCGAGHAYKFSSLLGRILTELAVDGRTSYNISEFNLERPAITDPEYKPNWQMMGYVQKEENKSKL